MKRVLLAVLVPWLLSGQSPITEALRDIRETHLRGVAKLTGSSAEAHWFDQGERFPFQSGRGGSPCDQPCTLAERLP